jgi:hypothetical protein
MTKLLEQAFGEISRLPEADDAAEREWERLLRDPRSEQVLGRLLGEADAEIARGEVHDTDPGEA